MEIRHEEEDGKGLFFVEQDGERVAEMVYSTSPSGNMVIEHTEVSDALRGKNVGQELVRSGVEYARQQGIKIVAMCPFAKALITKRHEWSDILA